MLNLVTPQFQLKPRGLGRGTLKCAGFIELKPEVSPREQALCQKKRATALEPRQPRQAVWVDTSKYPAAKLRELRKERGVGRPPKRALPGIDFGWDWKAAA